MVQPFKLIEFRQLMFRSVYSSNRNGKLYSTYTALQKSIPWKFPFLRKFIFLGGLLLFCLIEIQAQQILINDSVAILPKGSYTLSNLTSINPQNIKFEKLPGRRINIGFTGNEFYFILLKLSAPETLFNQYLTIDFYCLWLK